MHRLDTTTSIEDKVNLSIFIQAYSYQGFYSESIFYTIITDKISKDESYLTII